MRLWHTNFGLNISLEFAIDVVNSLRVLEHNNDWVDVGLKQMMDLSLIKPPKLFLLKKMPIISHWFNLNNFFSFYYKNWM